MWPFIVNVYNKVMIMNVDVRTVNELILWATNTEELWRSMEYVAKSLIKKMKKGTEPDIKYLTDSSVVQKITRATYNSYTHSFPLPKMNTETRHAVCNGIAEKIIEYAKELYSYEK